MVYYDQRWAQNYEAVRLIPNLKVLHTGGLSTAASKEAERRRHRESCFSLGFFLRNARTVRLLAKQVVSLLRLRQISIKVPVPMKYDVKKQHRGAAVKRTVFRTG